MLAALKVNVVTMLYVKGDICDTLVKCTTNINCLNIKAALLFHIVTQFGLHSNLSNHFDNKLGFISKKDNSETDSALLPNTVYLFFF